MFEKNLPGIGFQAFFGIASPATRKEFELDENTSRKHHLIFLLARVAQWTQHAFESLLMKDIS